MQIAVIIPAAGSGQRFTENQKPVGGKSKIEQDLYGRPVFLRSVELFLNRPEVEQIILAVNPDGLEAFRVQHADKLGFHGVTIVAGGRTERWQTVQKALETVRDNCTHVAVHDAARPLASPSLIDRLFEAARHFEAVIPGLALNGTLKRVTLNNQAPQQERDPIDAILGPTRPSAPGYRVVETVDRTGVVEAQTPQIFALPLLRRAYGLIASRKNATITDDAGLVEALGQPVYVIDGEAMNFKITRPGDLKIAEACQKMFESKRVEGLGRKRRFADEDDQ